MTRSIVFAASFGGSLLACGGRTEFDPLMPQPNDGAGSGSAGPSRPGSSSGGSSGSEPSSGGTLTAGGTSSSGGISNTGGTSNASGGQGSGGEAGESPGSGGTASVPGSNCVTSGLDYCVTVEGYHGEQPFAFSCTKDKGQNRVRFQNRDAISCGNPDRIHLALWFPPLDEESFGPGPFDIRYFEHADPPSPGALDLYVGSGMTLSTDDLNLKGGRLRGVLEQSPDDPSHLIYSGTFEAAWYPCPKGCDAGAIRGTFRAVFDF
jgi:hypothetical protein